MKLQTQTKPDQTNDQMSSMVTDNPIGWIMAILVPAALFFVIRKNGLDNNTAMFISIISISLIMWIFSLLAIFIAPLFAVLLILLFDVAPQNVVLSGFSSGGFLLTFSVLGLGVVVSSSGLTYRYTLWMIKLLPRNTFGYQAALFLTGLLFTPIVPSILGRTAIAAPVLGNMFNSMIPEDRNQAAPLLYTGGLDGITYLGAVFLTGAPANLFIFGLLPAQDQWSFQFLQWTYAASLTGMIMLVCYFILSGLFFRSYRRITVNRNSICNELKRLGPVSWREWLALFCIILLAVGIGTTTLHKIKIPFIAFTVFLVLLFLGILSPKDFKTKIDWGFLFLLGSVIGIIATMNHLHIDRLLIARLDWLGIYMRNDFKMFILMLCAMIMVTRFFLPMGTTNFIFATALLPLADASGISPWLIGFIILIISETSLFNYQSPHIGLYKDKSGDKPEFSEQKISLFRGMLLVVKLLAIYASIPFWIGTGIL
ncbi:SLC13 family permease [Desulfobacula phenolica]|uniref:Di-and tricarboxylate transporter n=1 Tax=Desulfobacula phenolica TaxID=90732 RepID=A0A1H2JQP4_9BACT|nr:SLC13 family permease [Desulfobacula phenolica]SDU58451.1 Di-and tricarboxylate transporter [Desulfobacula phenolica]